MKVSGAGVCQAARRGYTVDTIVPVSVVLLISGIFMIVAGWSTALEWRSHARHWSVSKQVFGTTGLAAYTVLLMVAAFSDRAGDIARASSMAERALSMVALITVLVGWTFIYVSALWPEMCSRQMRQRVLTPAMRAGRMLSCLLTAVFMISLNLRIWAYEYPWESYLGWAMNGTSNVIFMVSALALLLAMALGWHRLGEPHESI